MRLRVFIEDAFGLRWGRDAEGGVWISGLGRTWRPAFDGSVSPFIDSWRLRGHA